jgi:hypothetical protein
LDSSRKPEITRVRPSGSMSASLPASRNSPMKSPSWPLNVNGTVIGKGSSAWHRRIARL